MHFSCRYYAFGCTPTQTMAYREVVDALRHATDEALSGLTPAACDALRRAGLSSAGALAELGTLPEDELLEFYSAVLAGVEPDYVAFTYGLVLNCFQARVLRPGLL